MIYGPGNSQSRAGIWQVEPPQKLMRIVKLCTRTGRIWYHAQPAQLDWSGENVQLHVAQYDTIVPIFGGHPLPCLFHCYGPRRELGPEET